MCVYDVCVRALTCLVEQPSVYRMVYRDRPGSVLVTACEIYLPVSLHLPVVGPPRFPVIGRFPVKQRLHRNVVVLTGFALNGLPRLVPETLLAFGHSCEVFLIYEIEQPLLFAPIRTRELLLGGVLQKVVQLPVVLGGSLALYFGGYLELVAFRHPPIYA